MDFKTNLIIKLAILLSTSSLTSCYVDNEEELYPQPKAIDTCLTRKNISYKVDVVPLLQASCYKCHAATVSSSNGKGITFDSHVGLVNAINTKKLLGAIKRDGTAANMPRGAAKWSDCDIAVLDIWKNEGMKDN